MNKLSRILLVVNLLLFAGLVGLLGYNHVQRAEQAALDEAAVDRIVARVEEKLERYRAESLRASEASQHTVAENMSAIREEITATLADALGEQDIKLRELSSMQDDFAERYAAQRESPASSPASSPARAAGGTVPDQPLVLSAAAVSRAAEPAAADALVVPAGTKGFGADAGVLIPAVARDGAKPMASPAPQVAAASEATNGRLADGEKRKLAEIHFSHGSFDLSPGARQKAEDAFKSFAELNASKVRVIGFTDTTGPADKNLELSRQRAAAVADLLSGLGIPSSRIEVVGRGEIGSPFPTEDETDEPLNRCVGIVAVH